MNKKSCLLGVVIGIVLTLGVLFVISLGSRNSADNNSFQYLEKPLSYENKKETSFQVIQVFDKGALAAEVSDKANGLYLGNAVVILGKNFYSNQVVTVKNPQRIGTYSYTSNAGLPMTVPVIDGKIE